MRRVQIAVTTAVCVGLLAGCAAETSDTPGLTASPTAAESGTPTPTPTPTGIVETSDTDLGVVFEDVPELSGDEAEVYNWIAVYEKEFWRTLTTNTVSPAFALIASAEQQAKLQALAQSNIDDKWLISGIAHDSIGDISVQGDTASGTVCRDFTKATASVDGRLLTSEEAELATPTLKKVTLARVPAEQRWIVQTSESVGTC